MSGFDQAVYAVVQQVPEGRVTTYGTIAMLLGKPMAARAVGYALRRLPPDAEVPWHRVINQQGKVSPRNSEGSQRQRLRLEREGLPFDAEDRIDLRGYGWPIA